MCESLQEAHSLGLVHRDIKPANIHLGRVGLREDFVKVLDFGLVRSTTGPSAESLSNAAGMAAGTPAYMAPEMAHGLQVDGRADLYSLGCVAYFLLTGHLVFEGDTPLQTILQHLQNAPEPPSRRTTSRHPRGAGGIGARVPRQAAGGSAVERGERVPPAGRDSTVGRLS